MAGEFATLVDQGSSPKPGESFADYVNRTKGVKEAPPEDTLAQLGRYAWAFVKGGVSGLVDPNKGLYGIAQEVGSGLSRAGSEFQKGVAENAPPSQSPFSLSGSANALWEGVKRGVNALPTPGDNIPIQNAQPASTLPDLGGKANASPEDQAAGTALAIQLGQAKAQGEAVGGLFAQQLQDAQDRAAVRSKFLPYRSPDTGVYYFSPNDDLGRQGLQFRALPVGAIYNGSDGKQYTKTSDTNVAPVPEDKQVFEPMPSTPLEVGAKSAARGFVAGLGGVGAMGTAARLVPELGAPAMIASGLAGAALAATGEQGVEQAIDPRLIEQEMRDIRDQPKAAMQGNLIGNAAFFRPGLAPGMGIKGALASGAVGAGLSLGQSSVSQDPEWATHAAENAAMFGLMGRPTRLAEHIMTPTPAKPVVLPWKMGNMETVEQAGRMGQAKANVEGFQPDFVQNQDIRSPMQAQIEAATGVAPPASPGELVRAPQNNPVSLPAPRRYTRQELQASSQAVQIARSREAVIRDTMGENHPATRAAHDATIDAEVKDNRMVNDNNNAFNAGMALDEDSAELKSVQQAKLNEPSSPSNQPLPQIQEAGPVIGAQVAPTTDVVAQHNAAMDVAAQRARQSPAGGAALNQDLINQEMAQPSPSGTPGQPLPSTVSPMELQDRAAEAAQAAKVENDQYRAQQRGEPPVADQVPEFDKEDIGSRERIKRLIAGGLSRDAAVKKDGQNIQSTRDWVKQNFRKGDVWRDRNGVEWRVWSDEKSGLGLEVERADGTKGENVGDWSSFRGAKKISGAEPPAAAPEAAPKPPPAPKPAPAAEAAQAAQGTITPMEQIDLNAQAKKRFDENQARQAGAQTDQQMAQVDLQAKQAKAAADQQLAQIKIQHETAKAQLDLQQRAAAPAPEAPPINPLADKLNKALAPRPPSLANNAATLAKGAKGSPESLQNRLNQVVAGQAMGKQLPPQPQTPGAEGTPPTAPGAQSMRSPMSQTGGFIQVPGQRPLPTDQLTALSKMQPAEAVAAMKQFPGGPTGHAIATGGAIRNMADPVQRGDAMKALDTISKQAADRHEAIMQVINDPKAPDAAKAQAFEDAMSNAVMSQMAGQTREAATGTGGVGQHMARAQAELEKTPVAAIENAKAQIQAQIDAKPGELPIAPKNKAMIDQQLMARVGLMSMGALGGGLAGSTVGDTADERMRNSIMGAAIGAGWGLSMGHFVPRTPIHFESMGPGGQVRPDVPTQLPPGADVTMPHGSYGDLMEKNPKGDWYVNQTPGVSNKGKVLLVQFDNALINPPHSGPPTLAEHYYDALYAMRKAFGYSRMPTTWDVPQWQAVLTHALGENADLYIVKDMAQAKQFMAKSGYGHVAFSALDVNKHLIGELAPSIPGKIDIGGYTDTSAITSANPNATRFNSMPEYVNSLGLNYEPGFDYRLYRGADVIGRLQASTGCSYKTACSFCTIERQVVTTPASEVNQQLDAFKDLNGSLIYLNDKTFGQASNYTDMPMWAEKLKAANPDFKGFIVQTTAAQMKKFSDDFLRRSGIAFAEIGVESYNDSVLKPAHKPASEKLIDQAVDILRKNNIAFIPNIMIGLPGETAATYAHTMDFLRRNSDIISHANIYNLAIYPDAELGTKIKTKSALDANENSIVKSFHTDPQVHQQFADELYKWATEQLDHTPAAFQGKPVTPNSHATTQRIQQGNTAGELSRVSPRQDIRTNGGQIRQGPGGEANGGGGPQYSGEVQGVRASQPRRQPFGISGGRMTSQSGAISIPAALRAKPPEKGTPAENVDLVHYSGRGDLHSIDPDFIGKGKANLNDRKGLNQSFYYVAGSSLGQDEGLINSPGAHEYHAAVPAWQLYPFNEDPLGVRKNSNRELQDQTIMDAGYKGIRANRYDGAEVVHMFSPIPAERSQLRTRPEPAAVIPEHKVDVFGEQPAEGQPKLPQVTRSDVPGNPATIPVQFHSPEQRAADTPAQRFLQSLKGIAPGQPMSEAAAQPMGIAPPGTMSNAQLVAGMGTRAKNVLDQLTRLPEYTPFKRAVNEWFGWRQQASLEARQIVQQVERIIPDKIGREAVVCYIQAGGNPDTLAKWRDMSTVGARKDAYDRALYLTPEEIQVAQKAQQYYADQLEPGRSWGVLNEAKVNYVNQIWKKEYVGGGGMQVGGRMTQFFRSSRPSVFATYFEGEHAGFVPENKDIAADMAIYGDQLNKVIATKKFIRDLLTMTASDGRPLAGLAGSAEVKSGDFKANGDQKPDNIMVRPNAKPEDMYDYRSINNPALKKWHWLTTDNQGQHVVSEGDLLLHPEIANKVDNILSGSRIRNWYNEPGSPLSSLGKGVIKTIDQGGQFTKASMLGFLSPFHQVQEGTHAIGHRVNPFGNLPEMDPNNPDLQRAMNHGLAVAGDSEAMHSFMEGLGGTKNILWKTPVIGKWAQDYSTYLFNDYIPKLKFQTYLHIEERNLARYAPDIKSGKVSADDVMYLSAHQANAAYGHLNYADIGMNPTFRHVMQSVLLAPDFLFARAQFAGQAAKGLISRTGTEQAMALATLAATFYTAARIGNKLSDDDYHFDHPFEVKVGNAWYSMRSVPEDMYKAYSDTRQFINARLNPFIARGTFEMLSGRNYRGEKEPTSQLLRDLALRWIPINIHALPGVRDITDTGHVNPISWWQEFMGTAGFHAKRYSPLSDAFTIVQDWKEANKIQDTGSYPQSKYAAMRYALEDNDIPRAQAEYDKLVQAAPAGEAYKVGHGFLQSVKTSWTGSKHTDEAMMKSLTPDQQATLQKAAQARKAVYYRFLALKAPAQASK